MTLLKERLAEYAAAVEKALQASLPDRNGLQREVVDAMGYSLLGGGKRLRAALTLEFCRSFSGEWKQALPFACAIEMVHAYSLIHDDLPCMDDDDMRRGKPSCHKRYGEAMALLAGDGLLTLAFETMLKADLSTLDASVRLHIMQLLAQAAGVDGMIGGQVIDISSVGQAVEEPVLRTMHALKTGAMIRAAAGMGASIAGCSAQQMLLVDRYAAAVGLAFQITDDILDEIGEEAVLGKPVHSDEQQQKTTYVTLYGIARSRELASEQVEDAKNALHELGLTDAFLYQLADWILLRNN